MHRIAGPFRRVPLAVLAAACLFACGAEAGAQEWYRRGERRWKHRLPITIEQAHGLRWKGAPVVLPVTEVARAIREPSWILVDPDGTGRDDPKETGGRALPAQLDDLDGNDLPDELVFQADLSVNTKKTLFLYYDDGAPPEVEWTPRAKVLPRRNSWESDLVAFRMYENRVDVFAKHEPGFSLETLWKKGHNYHKDSPAGMDVLHIKPSWGFAAVAAWRDGKILEPGGKVDRDSIRFLSGPVRASLQFRMAGGEWGKTMRAERLLSAWAGQPILTDRIALKAPDDETRLAVGFGDGHANAIRKGRVRLGAKSGILAAWWTSLKEAGHVGAALVLPPDITPAFEHDSRHEWAVFERPRRKDVTVVRLFGWERMRGVDDWGKFYRLSDDWAERYHSGLAVETGKPEDAPAAP